MSTPTHEPEPVPEFAPGGVIETRGGDRPADYIPFNPVFTHPVAPGFTSFTDDLPDAGDEE